MAANFEVKFIVDRVSANYKVQITDTSTGFTLVKANTKITFPDGYVLENTDVSNPDISSAGGNIQKTLRLDVNNKPVTGDYTINFTGYDASDNEYTSQKQFNFTWSEPSIVIQDLSDSGVPVVKFKDITVWDEGNFTETATTREFSVDYPSTSAVDGTTKTSSETNLSSVLEIDMVDDLQYYEGVYDVSLNADILYSHTNGYVTVQYKRNSTQEFTIKRTPGQTDLLDKISQYKANIDAYKTTNPSLYKKYAEDYDNVLALYSHAVSRYKLGVGDGAQDSIEELLELIDDQTPHVYLSTPLTSFSIDENDFGAVAQVVKLKSEIGTFDSDGNLQTIAKAFADELFEVEATDFKAEASKLSTLLAQFGTYDPDTNTFSFLATADYFEQVKTYADDDKASAVALNILFSQFGAYDPDTETFTFSSTADYFNEVKTYADEDKASAQKLTTLTSQFGSYDPDTDTFTFNNTADYFEQVKTYADENSSAANKVSSLGSTFGSFDGDTFSTSEAKITEELNTYTGLNLSNSTYFQNIEADIESKPLVFRQAAQPAVTEPVGSIWYDTDDENKVYILVSGTPNVWTLTDDERIGASASKITSMSAKFGSFDGNDFTLNNTDSDYWNAVKLYADTNSAAATKVENLGAELVTFNPDNTVDSITLSSDFSSAIDTFVSDVANSALASKVEGLRVDIEGQDGTGGVSAQVTENQQAVAIRPKIFRQDAEPATTEPEGSLWFDTNDSNKAYVLVGDDGDPETFTWTVTRDEALISSVEDKPFIFRQDDAPATSNPEGSIWYDTNDGNKLYVLVSTTWTATQDSDIATAQATADGRPKVFRQAEAPNTTEPEFSVWYDTDDNNLSYVLIGDGGDPETFTWTETVDGRVTDLLDFAEARYSLNVDADGVVTGLELYSASGPNTTVSTFKVTADKFIVRESSTDFVPFTLDGSQLKLDVPLNGVSGSFSGSLTAATGTFSGNVDGNIDGTSASTVKSNAADGATAKGITDDLTSVVAITSSDIAIVNSGETKTFNDDGTPFYVDNAGQFSLGDKLSYDPSTNTLSVTGAITIESVSGITKSDVGLGNVDNNSTATILAGDLTGSIDGTAVATVKSNAADGASAKAETDKLTSVVSLTNSDIAIINDGETKTYNDAGTPFYVDNTGQFSLGNKLSFDGSNLSVSGTITMSASSTIDGTTASTVKSGAADGANAKDTTDNLESVITITNTKIYQGTGTFGNANTGFYLDDAGQFSLKDKLSFDGTTLSVDGQVTATSGSIGGVNLASNKLYVGTGTYNNSNTAFYLDDAGQFSLKDKLSWDGTSLTIDGEITSTSGNIGGWEINSTEIKSPAISGVNRLEFSPTDGFIVNDDDNNTALLVNYGGLSSLSSTTTGVTFADVSNAEVASWDETVQAGNTLIKIPNSNERYIYSSNYLTASFVNDPHGGSYSYEISVDSITGAVATLTGTSEYLKATLALHVQIATDTSFNTVIKDVELYRTDVTGATNLEFTGVSNKPISFSVSDAVTDVYIRFYWYRLYVVAYNDSITWSPKTFNVSSADANDDLVFLTYNGTTELTNEGVQIINDPTTYFKVDRANFTSGNPYVDIGGDVKVDGDFTVTGNINIEGDVENSDVSVSNLRERLGEINSDFTIGASSSIDATFSGDVTVSGSLHGPATFYIDPSPDDTAQPGGATTDTGTVVILGDLQVTGQTTTVDSTVVSIADLNMTLASNASNASEANGAGLTIAGASATMTYNSSSDRFVFNKDIQTNLVGNVTGALTGNASTATSAATLTTTRNIAISGAVTGNADFNGGSDITISTTATFDLDDVTDNGATTTNSITIADNAESFTALTLETSSTTYVKQDFKTDTLAASKAYIIAYGSANPQDGAFAIKNNANHTTTNGTAGDIWFEANGYERLRIKGSDGTVTINNNLDVAGTTTTNDIIVDFNTGTLSHGVIFRGVSGSAGDVGIRANGEAFEIYEPEQSNKVWLSIADDPEGNGIAAQLNSPSGFTPILTNYNKGSYVTKAYIDGLNVDADTLDGISSGGFIRDFGVSAQANINTIGTTSGKYRWNVNTVGRPAEGQSNEYGTLLHLNYDDDRVTQIAHDIDQENLYLRTLDTSDDTATDWKRLLTDSDSLNADTLDSLDSTAFLRSNTADAFTGGTLTISSTAPILDFVDTNSFTDANDRFRIRAAGDVGQIRWYDSSAATDTVLTTFYPNGNVSIAGELSLGGAVINMANDDGFVYDDANNVMKVKYDGNQYDILTAANHTSFTDSKYLRSDQDDTTTGTITIQKGLLDATFLSLLNQNTGGDIGQQRSFIDFNYVDSNTNETPQVRIGAEVGRNGDANTQEKEGSGAFVVYTNNADTVSGIAGASLAERFRVDFQGRVGINNNSPFAKLQVTGAAQGNGHYDDFATTIIEDNECRLQLLATNDGNDASTILLTNVQSSTDNRHWVIGHRGPSRSNRFEIGYVTSTTGGNIGTGGFADFVIDTSGRVGINIDTPTEQFEVNGDVRIYGSGSTIGGATVGNASLLVGSPTSGIGIDNNEIHSTGAMYIGTNTEALVLRPATSVLINTTTTTGSAKLVVNGFLSAGSSAIAQFDGFIRVEGQVFMHDENNNTNAARLLYDGTNGLSFTTEGTGSRDFGIGTTSPSQRLSVEGGSIKLNNNNADAAYYLWLNKKEGQDGGILLQRDNSLDWQMVNVGTSGNLWFYSYGTSSAALTIERSSARVGIVNTSPAVQLHVGTAALGASGGTPSIIGSNGISCGSGSRIAVDTGYYSHGYMQFNSSWGTESRYGLYGYYGISLNTRSGNSALVVRGDSNNVGIRCEDPQTALEIRGSAPYITISNTAENDGGIYFNDYQAGANPAASSQVASIKWSSSDNKMRICNQGINNLAIGIDTEGDVGIGTDSPTGKFNSYISAARQLTHNGNGGDLSIISDNNSQTVMYVKGTGSADLLNVYANTVEVFNIAANGNLSVFSATNGVGAKINFSDNRPTVTQFGTMEYTHLNTQSYGQGEAFKFYGSETSMAFHVAGIGLFTGDIIAYYSDMRLKTKIGDIENPIGKLQALNGFYYEPNEVAQSYGYEVERKIGLSAQEVKKVVPEAVSDAAIGDGYMAVDYAKLVPVLVEAIKEQQKQIDELKVRLDGST